MPEDVYLTYGSIKIHLQPRSPQGFEVQFTDAGSGKVIAQESTEEMQLAVVKAQAAERAKQLLADAGE